MNKKQVKELYNSLPEEAQYDIDMTIYDEFNDDSIMMNETLYDEFSEKDRRELEHLEYLRWKELVIDKSLKLGLEKMRERPDKVYTIEELKRLGRINKFTFFHF